MTQQPLFGRDDYPAGFGKWLDNNADIYRAFVAKSLELRFQANRNHYSARAIVEVIRWETALRQKGEPTFKINNNYVSGLARLTISAYPQLEGFFQIRDQLGYKGSSMNLIRKFWNWFERARRYRWVPAPRTHFWTATSTWQISSKGRGCSVAIGHLRTAESRG